MAFPTTDESQIHICLRFYENFCSSFKNDKTGTDIRPIILNIKIKIPKTQVNVCIWIRNIGDEERILNNKNKSFQSKSQGIISR